MAIATRSLMATPAEQAVLQHGDAQLLTRRGAQFPYAGRVFPPAKPAQWFYFAAIPDYSTTPTVAIYWYAIGGSASQTVTWKVAVAAMGHGDTDRIADKAFGADVTATAQTIGGDQYLRMQTVSISGLAINDWVVLRLTRDLTDTSASGADAVCLGLALNFTGA
jgi:hypothetical protein